MKLIKLFALIAMMVMSYSTWAACPGQKTTIFLINGVNVTEEDAEQSRRYLAITLWSLPSYNRECIEVKLAYTKSEGLITDLLEAARQKVNEGDITATIFWKMFEGLEPGSPWFLSTVGELVNQLITYWTVDEKILAQINEHLDKFRAEPRDNRLILVAHSQGNLFVNEEWREMRAEEKARTKIIAIATPAASVADSGPYTTIEEDKLITNLVGAAEFNIPAPNRGNGTFCLDDWLCHGFRSAYLASFTKSEKKILKDIGNALPIQLSSIQFIDSNLTECINNQNWQYLEQATNLSCSGKTITNLSGIENLKFLRTLDLSGNTINDLSHLSGLTQLEQLNLSGNTGLSCVELDELAVKLSSTTITRPAECVPSTTWSITPPSVSVNENSGTVSFTVSRSSSLAAQTVYVSTVQNQGATNSGDYVGKPNEAVLFGAGQAQQLVTVTINDDTAQESNETFGLIVQESSSDPINTNLASATFTIVDNDTPNAATHPLNDTGITTCSNDTTNGLACPVAGFPGQDGEHGRDAQALAGTLQKIGGGHAGFDFTKLDSNGNPLAASATAWDCVKDNVTGLVWEVKTDDGGLRDKDNTYSWYEPDSSKNGGDAGAQNGGICIDSACNTQGYVQAVNVQGLCGTSDWRMPNTNELLSILNNATVSPTIDTNYFPNTSASFVWSSSPSAYFSNLAWYVDFNYGYVYFGVSVQPYQSSRTDLT